MGEVGDEAPVSPEVLVRVQPIPDLKAFKRHLLRMFEQGQPHYPDAYDADAEPWPLWPEMVEDEVRGWRPIGTERHEPDQLRVALAFTFSMPAGTDPAANQAAALAVARNAFAGREQVWVAGEHEGPFVKLMVEYRNEDGKAVPSGPADLRRYREAYARELNSRGVAVQATTRGSRGLGFGEGRDAYKARQRSGED